MVIGGGGRNRTGVHGFAVRCMATLPPRRAFYTADLSLPAHTVPKENGEASLGFPACSVERETSLELATSTLARLRSTN